MMLLLGFKLRTWSYRKEDIYRLDFGKVPLTEWMQKRIPVEKRMNQIILNIGTKTYVIQGQHEIEISWFARELSRYLNLPLNSLAKHKNADKPTASQKDLEKPQKAIEKPKLKESSPARINKPVGSKVKVTNAPQMLEILIPARGFHRQLIPLILITIFIYTFVLVLLSSAIANSGGWLGVSLPILLLCLCLYYTWEGFSTFLRKVRLRITKSEISLTSKILGVRCWPSFTASRQNVIRIELTRLVYESCEGSSVEVPPQINIWVGIEKFSLGAEHGLTSPELDWLARELSDRLNLPIIDVG